MKIQLIALAAALALGACGDNGNGDDGTLEDTTHSMGGSHPADTSAMHDSMPMGDMTANMPRMNETMVSMLGAADSAYEMRFIDLMVPHHEGAVMMAEDAQRNAVHPELQELAGKMIEEQRKEIAELKKLRQQWYGDSTVAMMMMHGDSTMMGMDMNAMNQQMMSHLGVSDSSYDARFIDMMIPHHQGAIMMAQDAIAKATKPELKAMAQKMADDQKKEIAQLEEWRRTWYGQIPM